MWLECVGESERRRKACARTPQQNEEKVTENIPAENTEQGATLGNTEETLSVEKTVEESSLETGEKLSNEKADAAESMTAEPREDNAATKKNTEDNTHESHEEGTRFTDLGLDPRVLSALEEVGYEKPSPIQEQTIPPLLDGNDVVGLAQTGTGKTAAFALPALSRMAELADINGVSRDTQVLVLAPTRELALQVA